MNLSKIANVVDIEHDNGRLIEIGITTVNLEKRQIIQTYCIPIKPDFEISPEIQRLTGWSSAKLKKQGIEKEEALRRLLVYGFANRLLISDSSNEISFLEETFTASFSPHRLNVSILFALITGKDINFSLEAMLKKFEMEFEGRLHSGADDSQNIARLFLRLIYGDEINSLTTDERMDSLERELLLRDVGKYGYNLTQVSAKQPADILHKMLVSEEGRILEGIPVVLAHMLMKDDTNLDLFEIEESLPSGLRKRFRICAAVTYWFLFWAPNSKQAQLFLKKYLNKRDPSTLEFVQEKISTGQKIPIGDRAVYDIERLGNTFKSYVVEQLADEQTSLNRQLEIKRASVFNDAVSELFTEKQKSVMMKVLNNESLTKTDREYYSRVIKPRLKALRNPDVQSIATTLLGY